MDINLFPESNISQRTKWLVPVLLAILLTCGFLAVMTGILINNFAVLLTGQIFLSRDTRPILPRQYMSAEILLNQVALSEIQQAVYTDLQDDVLFWDPYYHGFARTELRHDEIRDLLQILSTQTVIEDCARALGLAGPLPRAMTTANPGRVKAICLRADISNVRPLCTAMLLAAVDDTAHPFRRLAAMSPQWFIEMNEIADAAGDQVHGGGEARSLAELRKHAERTVRPCHELLSALRAPVLAHVSPRSREARHG